jgi:hypothetical protein
LHDWGAYRARKEQRDDAVPSNNEIVETYDIALLKTPGDLQLTADGDIAVHDGDLQLGDDQYNAMFRLVQSWRYNSPTLEDLFNLTIGSRQSHRQLNNELENVMSRLFATSWSAGTISEYHATNDLIGANEIGEAACAGAFFVILNNLLMRFKYDLRVPQERWVRGEPLMGGASFGALVTAAANNFRHHDEWRRAKRLTRQQRESVKVLQPALGVVEPIRRNVCAALLDRLSYGKYEQVPRTLFAFAKSVTIAHSS